ncbi:Fis family transcriptional regulator [Candidatus Endobugula sertula]|uniref:Fis family transcriptional regulator n=1 Tax=Candidatus Endobugula sertula TaxID=62101 RepID=A0A1D2QTB2_9GAMM|nr:Fis family transcriptional regulator [Candidatus Endobugula sertula]
MNKILIVEDEVIIRMALRKLLERHHYEIREAGSVKEATKYNFNDYDLIISDLRLPGKPGTELINLSHNTPVLIMTSYASLRSAVDAMRMGAVDYIAKPFDHEEIVKTIERIISEKSIRTNHNTLSEISENESLSNQGQMIGSSDVMVSLFNCITKVAPTHATVLIHGETGTGKELVAKAIHTSSHRTDNPLVCINCAAIPETLIESELFGHEKGAFTGAASQREGLVVAANKGTLFLDEIGELPLEAQARLLRVLQEGEVRPVGSTETQQVDIRLLAATHRDLNELCQQGLFREDLYFRLNVIQLHVPPLRERGNDIITIAESLIERYCDNYGKPPLTLSQEAREQVLHYLWPGNVRELENTMQRAVILCEDNDEIDHTVLMIESETRKTKDALSHNTAPSPQTSASTSIDDLSLKDYFQHFVLENQEKMSETELAKKLGVSRKCLWERRQKLGIPRKKNT